MHTKVVRSTIDPTSVAIYWFVCLLQPCWGWETGSAFWASGPRGRHCWQGRCGGVAAVSSFCLKAMCVMIDCTASPAVPCMWHSLSWPPLGSFFPSSPPLQWGTDKNKRVPWLFAKAFGVFVFISPFPSGLWATVEGWRGRNQKESRCKSVFFCFPLPLKIQISWGLVN